MGNLSALETSFFFFCSGSRPGARTPRPSPRPLGWSAASTWHAALTISDGYAPSAMVPLSMLGTKVYVQRSVAILPPERRVWQFKHWLDK